MEYLKFLKFNKFVGRHSCEILSLTEPIDLLVDSGEVVRSSDLLSIAFLYDIGKYSCFGSLQCRANIILFVLQVYEACSFDEQVLP